MLPDCGLDVHFVYVPINLNQSSGGRTGNVFEPINLQLPEPAHGEDTQHVISVKYLLGNKSKPTTAAEHYIFILTILTLKCN